MLLFIYYVVLSDKKFSGTYRLSKRLVKEFGSNTKSTFMVAPKTKAGFSIERKVFVTQNRLNVSSLTYLIKSTTWVTVFT